MKPDKYRNKFRAPRADDRVRKQIAIEAARRMVSLLAPEPSSASDRLREASEADYYTAKRKAAAVLGHPVRPGDLPTDSEVRQALLELLNDRQESDLPTEDDDEPNEESTPEVRRISDHLDRFAIYKMRLEPLAAIKQDARSHPEGDALYHSLQVFERGREIRPYDEEFLTAALLHDVGKAIDPHDRATAAIVALDGTLTPRTAFLIAHLPTVMPRADRPANAKAKALVEASEFRDDLLLLKEMDLQGREPGTLVGTVDDAIAYIKCLERDHDLNDE